MSERLHTRENGNGAETDDRHALERSRFLSRSIDMDLTKQQALALAYRELGYSPSGIATAVESTEGTVKKWLEPIAVRYGFEAIESTPRDEQIEPEIMTIDRLLAYSDEPGPYGRSVRGDYIELAKEHQGALPNRIGFYISQGRRPNEDGS